MYTPNRVFIYKHTYTVFFFILLPLWQPTINNLVGITEIYIKISIEKFFNQKYSGYISFKIKRGKNIKSSTFYINSLFSS